MFTNPKLYLDFGTANCVIIKEGEGVVLQEPTVVAVDTNAKTIIEVGAKAKKMLGKEPSGIVARRPLQNGGISNYKLAFELLSNFLNKSLGNIRLSKPDVVVSVPSKLNSIEERALTKALQSYGVNQISLFPESMAAAIGAGLPTKKSSASMIVNMGGGTVETALISIGGIVKSDSHVGSGDEINWNIKNLIRDKFNLKIGELTAEKIKMKIGSCMYLDEPYNYTLSGKDLDTGQPKQVLINSNDVLDAIKPVISKILENVNELVEKSPSELVIDLADNGIALSGGTSLLHNIEEVFTKTLNIPAYTVDDPLTCVARGMIT